ncbi:MAG: hypothetical protein GY806_12295 [Gammaproteobacteria bacterium]|nr:hypothetical protein [Gammaproteobacteria bacterium]
MENSTGLDRDTEKAVEAYRAGDKSRAKACCRKLLKRDAENFNALQIMAMALRSEEHFEVAIDFYCKAMRAAPLISLKHQMCVDLATCYQEIDESDKALKLLDELLSNDLTNTIALHRKGVILRSRGEEQAALECFRQIIDYPPEVSSGADITRGKAHWYLLSSPILQPTREDISRAEADLLWLENAEEIAHIHFACYNGYERLTLYAEAWQALKQANEQVWENVRFDLSALSASLDQVYQYIEAAEIKTAELDNSYTPVFIAGLPRSGTTLLESVLLEHPAVLTRGESTLVAKVFEEIIGDETQLQNLGQAHIRHFAKKLESSLFKKAPRAEVMIEKTPNNFIYAALLIASFSKVKIIHTIKQPIEACLSIYRQHFLRQSQQAYSYDLVSTVLYYRWHARITDLLQQRFPQSVLNIQYDDMVSESSPVWPQIFEFCGLKWADSYLEFYQSRREVKTISASQVRQGVTNDYQSRAQHYGHVVDELKDLLKLDIPQLLAIAQAP